jgi:hemolysin activation/secretion protein
VAVWGATSVLAQAVASKPDQANAPVQKPTSTPVDPAPGGDAGSVAPQIKFNIREYRVIGAKKFGPQEIGDAVYPFLGPLRTEQDVEGARAALQALYHDKGYQSVTVEIPEQTGRGGIVFLKISENKVGRLRVKGSRFFSLSEIKKRAPSLAEGTLPNFNDIERDIVSLNQLADLQITPEPMRPGVEPGTVDVDLVVKDSFPLHGSLELNNRYSPDTTPLRINGSISYGNLWQAGHSAGFSFQIAPERLDDARVYSAYYTARFAKIPWLSLTLLGTKQDSDVATLGGTTSIGRGEIVGGRAEITLPRREGFYHSLTFGLDYKHFKDQQFFAFVEPLPVSYYPWSIAYSGTWAAGKRVTELNAMAVFHFRGMGSDQDQFDRKRFGADGSFFYLRGDLSHTHPLPGGFQLYGKVQGQASGRPLLPSEQFSGGGLDSARGYLESTAVGDNALFGTLELRSPSITQWWNRKSPRAAKGPKPLKGRKTKRANGASTFSWTRGS